MGPPAAGRRAIKIFGFVFFAGLIGSHGATLYFKSGFEDGVSLDLGAKGGRIVGTDRRTGFSWTGDLRRVPSFDEATLGSMGRIPEDLGFGLVDAGAGQGRALLMQVLHNNQPISTTRADFTLKHRHSPGFKQLYVRFKMRLDPKYPEAIAATGEWFQITEYKSAIDPAGFRKTLSILVEQDGNRFYPVAQWRLLEAGIKRVKTIRPLWTVPNKSARIPFGEWFDAEMLLKLGKANEGRFFYAINGKTVFDIKDKETVSSDPFIPLDHWSIFKVYQDKKIIQWMRDHGSVCQAWYDDLEIWDDVPTPMDRQTQRKR